MKSSARRRTLSATDRARSRLALSTTVSRETISRLDRLVAFLLRMAGHDQSDRAIDDPRIWTRHVADSLQLLKLAPDAKTWVDLGSGGGFPGSSLPVRWRIGRQRGASGRKQRQKGGLPARSRRVHRCCRPISMLCGSRISRRLQPVRPDIVTARALAPLPKLLGYVAPFVEKGAQALLLKGTRCRGELTEASKYWRIEADLVPSETRRQRAHCRDSGLQQRLVNRRRFADRSIICCRHVHSRTDDPRMSSERP